jgi:recombination protein RecT
MPTEQKSSVEIVRPGPQQLLKAELERIKPALAAVLPRHVTPERILKVVLSATARQPALLECTMASIVRAVMQAGELGLEVGGLLGEAYLVPYNVKVKDGNRERWEKQAQCIPGYRGLIKLARQSGQIAAVSAHPVFAGDDFTVNLATETISHDPDLAGDMSDEAITAAYCVVRFKEGGQQIEVMGRSQLDAVRSRSKAANAGPWVTDFAEMCRKSVVKRCLKYCPISAELAEAMDLDARAEEEGGTLTDRALVAAEPVKQLEEKLRAPRAPRKAAEPAKTEPAPAPKVVDHGPAKGEV